MNHTKGPKNIEKCDADARLISAAPELLNALENIVSELYESGCIHYMNEDSRYKKIFNRRLKKSEQAIKKARGIK